MLQGKQYFFAIFFSKPSFFMNFSGFKIHNLSRAPPMLILSAFLNSSDIQLPENVYFCGVNINFYKVTATFMEMRTIRTNFECVTQHGPNFKRMARQKLGSLQARIQENRIECISGAQLSGDKSGSIMFTHGPGKFIV